MSSDHTIDLASQRPDRHATVVCVRCGGSARLGRLWCPQCNGEKPEAAPQPAAVKSVSANQFSIETLLLVTTLAAICLGMGVANPLLGIPLTLLGAAALVRTIWIGRVHLRQGLAFELPEKVGSFVISLGVILGAVFAAVVVFVAVAGFGSIVARTFIEYGQPRTSAEQIAFVISDLVAPRRAGIWFLWATRPQ